MMFPSVSSTICSMFTVLRAHLLFIISGLLISGAASTSSADPVQRSVFLQRGPLSAQTVPISNHLWQQAMATGQPLSYQPQLSVDATENVESSETNDELVESFADSSVIEDALDPFGWVRVWANGVQPRIITTQRYSDAYWRFNIDLLALERNNLSEVPQYYTATPPSATFKSGAPTGGMRISASADLFYSFDLEFGWLGNITWVGRPTNEFNWNAAGARTYRNGAATLQSPATFIFANPNKTNFSSTLNAFEMNARFRWVAATTPFTGAWILGPRYVRFTEAAYVNTDQNQISLINPGGTDFTAGSLRTETINNLVGFQGGGELFWAVCRGVMIGGNLKGGIYGNHAVNRSKLNGIAQGGVVPSTGAEASYRQSKNFAAFFGEANVMVNAHIGGNWYVRGGYTGLFLANVSSAVTAVQQDLNSVSAGNTLIANGFYGGLEWKY